MTETLDRRTDKRAFNIQIRVFDALGAASSMLSIDDLCARLRLDASTIARALRRLRQQRALRSACLGGDWVYGLRPGAERPVDRRGRQPA